MIDLINKSLPNTIQVNGRDFSIYTDYRVWIKFRVEFLRWEKQGHKGILDIKYLFKNDIPEVEKMSEWDSLLRFAFPQNVIPKSNNAEGPEVIFYEYDGDYIYAAVLQQYGIDLIDTDMHWHKFLALLNGLVDTKLTEIMGYRSFTGEKVKDMDAQYRRLKDIWTPPVEKTKEEKEIEEKFNDYFGS